jgi:hypothetical protein
MLGAVVVKPNTDYVESWPDMYHTGKTYTAGKTYVECLPDFSDAHEKIDHIVHHFGDYLSMRQRARSLVVEAYSAEAIAQHMAKQIRSLVE